MCCWQASSVHRADLDCCHVATQLNTRHSMALRRAPCCKRHECSTTELWTPGDASRSGEQSGLNPGTGSVVQHARQSNHRKTLPPPSGHSTPVDRLSPQVITKLLYLLSQGETFSKVGICCRTFCLAMHNLRIFLLTLLYPCVLDRKSSRRSSSV